VIKKERKFKPRSGGSATSLRIRAVPASARRWDDTFGDSNDVWSKIVGEFIAAHSAPVALRNEFLYVRVFQPALHHELEQISKIEILRKLKKRFGSKTVRDIRFRVG